VLNVWINGVATEWTFYIKYTQVDAYTADKSTSIHVYAEIYGNSLHNAKRHLSIGVMTL